jgi:ABC-type multidrug transport system fused ATPase/permease subunit
MDNLRLDFVMWGIAVSHVVCCSLQWFFDTVNPILVYFSYRNSLHNLILLVFFTQFYLEFGAKWVGQWLCQEAINSVALLTLSNSDKKPPKSWPSEGVIKFDRLYMRYSLADEPVLKNLNFTIWAKQKVRHMWSSNCWDTLWFITLFLQGVLTLP